MSKITQFAVGSINTVYTLDINEHTDEVEASDPEIFESETEDKKAIIQAFIAKFSADIHLHFEVDVDDDVVESAELKKITDQADNEIPTSEIPDIIRSYIEGIEDDFERYNPDILSSFYDSF